MATKTQTVLYVASYQYRARYHRNLSAVGAEAEKTLAETGSAADLNVATRLCCEVLPHQSSARVRDRTRNERLPNSLPAASYAKLSACMQSSRSSLLCRNIQRTGSDFHRAWPGTIEQRNEPLHTTCGGERLKRTHASPCKRETNKLHLKMGD